MTLGDAAAQPRDATTACRGTNVAKVNDAPILHVNADDAARNGDKFLGHHGPKSYKGAGIFTNICHENQPVL